LVLLEAMALGVPVISTAVMGTRDVLKEGEGALIAKQGDPVDFSQKIINLLNDKELQNQLSERGKHYAASWSNETMTQQLLAYYQHVIELYSESSEPLNTTIGQQELD
jgi:glycosyltransferase involved in cell wall biosynthesis